MFGMQMEPQDSQQAAIPRELLYMSPWGCHPLEAHWLVSSGLLRILL